ncbi:hypothetical protein KKA72_01580 [Patescibacteria group bacterium]|nr:hypothetical protein [Patescibacteria group bacterium]MBU1877022.1 hypothetical protein [Patescibacteria group bacterium]
MAITFLEKRKKQQYMIPFLILVLLLTFSVIWYGILRPQQPSAINMSSMEEGLPSVLGKVEIDFNFLKNFTSSKFQLLETIPTFEKEAGRENPFIPF